MPIYKIEEKIINLCDLMCPQGGKIFTIDKRLIDIMIRRGAYSNTQYHIKETYKSGIIISITITEE